MRRLLALVFFLLPALAQRVVLGLAAEGQWLPLGLAGFVRVEQEGYLVEARAGWEVIGGFFFGLEGGFPLRPGYAFQGGLLYHPYHEALREPLRPSHALWVTLGLTNRSWNTDLPFWVGVALPLDPAFWERANLASLAIALVLFQRSRIYLEPLAY